MQVVIEIPDRLYNSIIDIPESSMFSIDCDSRIRKAIKNGTPLPKGLISINTLKQALCPHDEDYDMACISPHNLEICLEQLALDADKE